MSDIDVISLWCPQLSIIQPLPGTLMIWAATMLVSLFVSWLATHSTTTSSVCSVSGMKRFMVDIVTKLPSFSWWTVSPDTIWVTSELTIQETWTNSTSRKNVIQKISHHLSCRDTWGGLASDLHIGLGLGYSRALDWEVNGANYKQANIEMIMFGFS